MNTGDISFGYNGALIFFHRLKTFKTKKSRIENYRNLKGKENLGSIIPLKS